MKQVILTVAVIIALGVVAQERVKEGTEKPTLSGDKITVKSRDGRGELKANDGGIKGEVKSTTPAKSNGNSTVAEPTGPSGYEIGMERAEEARNNRTKAETESEALKQVETINNETKDMVKSIDTKLADARTNLEERMKAGKISKIDYETESGMLNDFKKRRDAINDELSK